MKRLHCIILPALFISAILAMSSNELIAQQDDTIDDYGAWFMFLGEGRFTEETSKYGRFKWWFDAHARFLDDSSGFAQSILRPGLGYAISDAVSVWLGYAWVHTDLEQSRGIDENRIWQQLIWSTRFEPVNFMSRSRLEQRFLDTGSDTGWRFRQFIKVAYPFENSRLGLAAYDELFFDLNDTDWGADGGIDQNRVFAGVGVKLAASAKAEIGYLNQFVRRANRDDAHNHILSLTLLLAY